MKGERLLKDTVMYSISTFTSKALALFTLPLFTHYFTTAEYGQWDIIMSTVYLLAPFASFEIVNAVYRWLMEESVKEKKNEIMTTGFISILRNLILFNLFVCLVNVIFKVPYGWQIVALVNVTTAASFFQQCSRGLGFNRIYAVSGLIQAIVFFISSIILIVAAKLRIETFFYATVISNGAGIAVVLKHVNFKNYIDIQLYSKKLLKQFFQYSVPMIPGALNWWIMNVSDRYLIAVYLGTEVNGIYAVANKIPTLIMLLSSVFFLAWKDAAIRENKAADKNQYYSKVFKYYFRFIAAGVICAIIVSKPLMEVLVAEKFISAWRYCGILILATLFNNISQFWGGAYHGSKQTKVILTTSLVGATVNITINFLFIRSLGLYAACISTCAAFLAMWLTRLFNRRNDFRISVSIKDFVALMTFAIMTVIGSLYIDGIMQAAVLCIAFFIAIFYNIEIVGLIIKSMRLLIAKNISG